MDRIGKREVRVGWYNKHSVYMSWTEGFASSVQKFWSMYFEQFS